MRRATADSENGMECMLRSKQENSEMEERLGIIPYMDKTLARNRRLYLQLVCALFKLDLTTLIEVDEVREHAGIFLVEKGSLRVETVVTGEARHLDNGMQRKQETSEMKECLVMM